jgi:quercetin dioxygenase-like cupin family protein
MLPMQRDKSMPANVLQPTAYATPETPLPRIAWAPEIADLHVNLVALNASESIGEHVNESLDVLLTCLAGEGELRIDDEIIPLIPGTVAVIPRGTRRGIVAGNNMLRYMTCHRKRGGLMPTLRSRS